MIEQSKIQIGKDPDVLIACVGGGSNAMGLFYPFIENKNVRLIGVEAGGLGLSTGKHAAPLNDGKEGILHGMRTYLMQALAPYGQSASPCTPPKKLKNHPRKRSGGVRGGGSSPPEAWAFVGTVLQDGVSRGGQY